MYLRNSLLYLASILLLSSTTSASLNLFEVQQITNFPYQCTSAYNTDISACSAEEITITGQITSEGRGICSIQCISALSIINRNLISACAGLQASPDTLIGLFFSGRGITYLCPNSVAGNGPAPSSTGTDNDSPSTSSTLPSRSSSEQPTSTTITSTTPSDSSETSAPPPSTTPPPPPSPTFQPTTAANNGVATVLTSESQRSDSPNPDAFGGGGSPFEIAANGASRFGSGGVPVAIAVTLFWALVVGSWTLLGSS